MPDECDILPIVAAEGSRFLRTILSDLLDQDAMIVVRCAGGMDRFAGFPSGDANNVAMLTENPAEAVYLRPSEWKSPLHLTGASVAPSQTYDVYVETAGGTRSAVVTVTTAIWGDLVGSKGVLEPDGTSDFRDITAVVNCFVDDVNAPPRARCDLHPALPDGVIDFKDIAASVAAFATGVYPYGTELDCTAN